MIACLSTRISLLLVAFSTGYRDMDQYPDWTKLAREAARVAYKAPTTPRSFLAPTTTALITTTTTPAPTTTALPTTTTTATTRTTPKPQPPQTTTAMSRTTKTSPTTRSPQTNAPPTTVMAQTTGKCLRDEVEDLLFQERAEAKAYRERAEARIRELERQLSQEVSSQKLQQGSSGSVTAAVTIALLVTLGWLTDRGRSMMLARRQRQREASRDVETPDGKRERCDSEGGEETELAWTAKGLTLFKSVLESSSKFTPFLQRNRKDSAKARGANRTGLFDCLAKTDDGVPEDIAISDDDDDNKASSANKWPEEEEARRIVNEQMVLVPVTPYQGGEAGSCSDVEEEDPDEIQVDEALLHTDAFDIDTWEPHPDCTGLTTSVRGTCAYAIKNIKVGKMPATFINDLDRAAFFILGAKCYHTLMNTMMGPKARDYAQMLADRAETLRREERRVPLTFETLTIGSLFFAPSDTENRLAVQIRDCSSCPGCCASAAQHRLKAKHGRALSTWVLRLRAVEIICADPAEVWVRTPTMTRGRLRNSETHTPTARPDGATALPPPRLSSDGYGYV